MIAIVKREIKAYFNTPLGFIYMGLFLLIAGIYFTLMNITFQRSEFASFLSNLLFIYLFSVPILTMKLFAEERRQRTDQLLLTSPISIPSIVIGKFLAALSIYAATMLITLLYAVVIAIYGDLQWAETLGSYIGFIFLGACYISIGIFISAGTENQLTAALVTFFCLFLILLIDPITMMIPADLRSGIISAGVLGLLISFLVFLNTRNWVITLGAIVLCSLAIICFWFIQKDVFFGFVRRLLGWFSLNGRYRPFTQGILKIDTLIYYSSFTALFLFLTVRIIEKRRWN
jgi:ABC-2 type transport system permease protein